MNKQEDEIQNLSRGISRIADYVFGLPCVTFNPEETGIVESTIKAVESIYELLKGKEEEVWSLKKNKHKHKKEHMNNTGAFRDPVEHYHALL